MNIYVRNQSWLVRNRTSHAAGLKRFFNYVYRCIIMRGFLLSILLFSLTAGYVSGQELRIEHKTKEDRLKTIRTDKPIMVKTFEGRKVKGMFMGIDQESIMIEESNIPLEDIMTISGFIVPGREGRTTGILLSIGAGVVLPVALYYILGGIAWVQPDGIFIGATILAFDLLLGYAGTSLLGIYPRRFSTYNWNIVPSVPADEVRPPILLPKNRT